MPTTTRTRRPPARPQRYGVAGGWLQRRRPEPQSPLQKAWGNVSAHGGKAGGLALVAGAAGLLFKNRDKVSSRARRGGHQ